MSWTATTRQTDQVDRAFIRSGRGECCEFAEDFVAKVSGGDDVLGVTAAGKVRR